MLTTFNEVNMDALMKIRNEHREAFEKKHGARLGFLSFFVKACIGALKELQAVNGEIRSEEQTSELKSLMRISYAVLCLKIKKHTKWIPTRQQKETRGKEHSPHSQNSYISNTKHK